MGCTAGSGGSTDAPEATRLTRKAPGRFATSAAAIGSPSREWVAVPSSFKRERTRRVEQRGEIEVDEQARRRREIERSGEIDAGAVGITGEMVGVACQLGVSGAEMALDGHEDVAALPAPMQAVEVGIERVIGGIFATSAALAAASGPTWKRSER